VVTWVLYAHLLDATDANLVGRQGTKLFLQDTVSGSFIRQGRSPGGASEGSNGGTNVGIAASAAAPLREIERGGIGCTLEAEQDARYVVIVVSLRFD
jgi:hypothetical protein